MNGVLELIFIYLSGPNCSEDNSQLNLKGNANHRPTDSRAKLPPSYLEATSYKVRQGTKLYTIWYQVTYQKGVYRIYGSHMNGGEELIHRIHNGKGEKKKKSKRFQNTRSATMRG